MKKYSIALSVFFMTFFTACHKEEQKQSSIWYINSQQYISDNISASIGKSISILSCNDVISGWDIRFYLNNEMPKLGSWSMRTFSNSGNNPEYVYIGFFKNDTLFAISPYATNTLNAHDLQGKASYTLEPTWFIKLKKNVPAVNDSLYTYTTDSVLISGTFNQP